LGGCAAQTPTITTILWAVIPTEGRNLYQTRPKGEISIKNNKFFFKQALPGFSLNRNTSRVLDTTMLRAELQIPFSLAFPYKSKLIPLKKVIKRTFLLSVPFFFPIPLNSRCIYPSLIN